MDMNRYKGSRYIKPIGNVERRVKKLIFDHKENTRKLAAYLNQTEHTLGNKLNGKTKFNQNDLIGICEHYEVSADYLLFGKE